jgi:hypothetical protein
MYVLNQSAEQIKENESLMILHKCFTYYVLHIYKTEQVAIAL